MKSITVFTPTYNRAHLLPRLYESLCNQTSGNFLWLIIDDGSTDNTRELVEKWKIEDKVDIQYYYKENGGMHTAHNSAYRLITTELNVCIDSDDFMPSDAIEIIMEKWHEIDDKSQIAGLIGLDAKVDGEIIGTKFPLDLKRGDLYSLYQKKIIKGDKKVVLKTEVIKKYPLYPEYKNEKLVPLGVLYLLIGLDYDFIYSNKVYCLVDYQAGGSSSTIFNQYFESPKGFMYERKIRLKYSNYINDIFKNSIHLGVIALILKNPIIVLQNNRFWYLTILLMPFSPLLYLYFKSQIK